MSELDAERRERLATVLAEHTYDYPDSFCGCGKHFDRPWFEWQAHVADALAPLIAGWLAEAEAAALREAAKEAEERGDIGKDGGPEAWEWLRGLIQRAEIDREIEGER